MSLMHILQTVRQWCVGRPSPCQKKIWKLCVRYFLFSRDLGTIYCIGLRWKAKMLSNKSMVNTGFPEHNKKTLVNLADHKTIPIVNLLCPATVTSKNTENIIDITIYYSSYKIRNSKTTKVYSWEKHLSKNCNTVT